MLGGRKVSISKFEVFWAHWLGKTKLLTYWILVRSFKMKEWLALTWHLLLIPVNIVSVINILYSYLIWKHWLNIYKGMMLPEFLSVSVISSSEQQNSIIKPRQWYKFHTIYSHKTQSFLQNFNIYLGVWLR
jgi:hypothetical protein